MTVSGWTTGRRYPSIEMLDRIASMLDIDVVEFFAPTTTSPVTLTARVGDTTIEINQATLTALATLYKSTNQ